MATLTARDTRIHISRRTARWPDDPAAAVTVLADMRRRIGRNNRLV